MILGGYTLGGYSSCATDFGAGHVLTCLGGYTLGGYTLGGYSSRATDFGAVDALTCPRRNDIEDPITQALFRESSFYT